MDVPFMNSPWGGVLCRAYQVRENLGFGPPEGFNFNFMAEGFRILILWFKAHPLIPLLLTKFKIYRYHNNLISE